LALGDEIVSALKLHKTVDTLDRWKAHHLAELVLAVRDAKESERAAAEAKLTKLLQDFDRGPEDKLWYPKGYELKKLGPILDKVRNKK